MKLPIVCIVLFDMFCVLTAMPRLHIETIILYGDIINQNFICAKI